MNINQLIKLLTPERYDALKRAVEIGKWPDGRVLGTDERETSLQILIAYDASHKDEQDRVGYIHVNDNECDHDDENHSENAHNLIAKI
jgi:uncharacterized protein